MERMTESASEPVLCRQCNKFYGCATREFLCSSCSKKPKEVDCSPAHSLCSEKGREPPPSL